MNIPAITVAAAALALSGCATDLGSRNSGTQWVYDGRAYNSYEACRDAKHRSRNRGAIAGAAAAGGVAALTGGNLGETALAAGAGAIAGGVIGSTMKKC